MKILRRIADVRAAQVRAETARVRWHNATGGLLSRVLEHPMAVLGAAAGVGLLMGRRRMRAWRVPGLGTLLGGGMVEGLALAARWIEDFALARRAAHDDVAEDARDGDKRVG